MVAAGLALVAIVALAATGTGLLLPGSDLSPAGELAVRLGGVLLAVVGLVVLCTRWGGPARIGVDDLPVALFTATIIFGALAVMSVAHSDVTLSGESDDQTTTSSSTTTSSTTTTTEPSTTTTITIDDGVRLPSPAVDGGRLLPLLLVVLVVVLIGVVLRVLLPAWGVQPRLRPGRALPAPPLDEPPVDAQSAEAGLTASLAAALDGDDPRAAIVAAYARLLDALAQAGGARRLEEAPHEHLSRVLGPLGVRPEPLHRLAELFVMARFSDHTITDEHRRTAVTLLETALDELRTATAATAAAAGTAPPPPP